MVSMHANVRGIERINNKSLKKNKESNIKKIMKRDAYERYFAYSIDKMRIYRYVKKDDVIYKYVLDKFNKKIITVYPVDFNYELRRGFKIRYRSEQYGI